MKKTDTGIIEGTSYKEIIEALKRFGKITYVYRQSVSLYKYADKNYYPITMNQFRRLKKEGLIRQDLNVKRVDEYIYTGERSLPPTT